jgi:hypothetical protein
LKKKNINNAQIDEIIKNASLSDVRVKSSEFFNNEENLNNIAENI